MIETLIVVYCLSAILALIGSTSDIIKSGSVLVEDIFLILIVTFVPFFNSLMAFEMVQDALKRNWPKFLAYKIWVKKPTKETK